MRRKAIHSQGMLPFEISPEPLKEKLTARAGLVLLGAHRRSRCRSASCSQARWEGVLGDRTVRGDGHVEAVGEQAEHEGVPPS